MTQTQRNIDCITQGVPGGSSKTRKTGTGQVTIKASGGTLHRIIVSKCGATANTLTLVDGATTLMTAILASTIIPYSIEFGIDMATSIKVQMGTANGEILVVYD